MIMQSRKLATVMLGILGAGAVHAEAARFAGVFGDHMVLQRDREILVWGTADPGAALELTLGDRSVAATADAAGDWKATFEPRPAGGPYTLALGQTGGASRSIVDVLVGDVWLCSGQSNMAWPVSLAARGAYRTTGTLDRIRLMTVRQASAPTPRKDFPAPPGWSVADPGTVQDFSAVCYFMARDLAPTIDAPLGLINASWGGSRIEAWLSAEALAGIGDFTARLELLEIYATDEAEAMRRYATAWEAWWSSAAAGAGKPWTSAASPETGWSRAPPVMQNWKTFGDPELARHHGLVWFGNSFRLTAEQAERGATLALGAIDEVDVTWLNGVVIGGSFGWGTERNYSVPPGVLRAGENRVTVNVLNTWDVGGMLGPAERVGLHLADGGFVPLGDGWMYRKVPGEVGRPPGAPWQSISGLAGLGNAMIAPLEGLRLAGALWYQGESNTGEGRQYGRLLTALTADWRRRFGADLPFIIVQLPNFGPLPAGPVESGWAEVRDAQRRVAFAEPATGLVATVDTGDPTNLHPPNKDIVARRAADVARVLAYGAGGLADGLSPRRAARHGNGVVVDFDPAVDTLTVAGARSPAAFELCPDPQGGCVYADAVLSGNRIYLSAPGVERADVVRHCWADAPICNLYGQSGLPVGSFEITVEAGRDGQ
jgi:sialate O-acetylesterase